MWLRVCAWYVCVCGVYPRGASCLSLPPKEGGRGQRATQVAIVTTARIASGFSVLGSSMSAHVDTLQLTEMGIRQKAVLITLMRFVSVAPFIHRNVSFFLLHSTI